MWKSASQGSKKPGSLIVFEKSVSEDGFQEDFNLGSVSSAAGLVHCDICLGNLPPKSLHSFLVAKG